MTRLIIKLCLFAAVFLMYDKLYLFIADFSADAEVDKRLEYVINGEMNKDIIIAGASTGSRDIIACQIEDSTGLSAYNLCYPGSDIIFHAFVIEALIEFNTPPEILLLVVDDDITFRHEYDVVYRKDRLYPLIKYPYIWKELCKREGRSEFFSRFLVLDRLNKYNFDLRQKSFTPIDSIAPCGSMPISWKRTDYLFENMQSRKMYLLRDENPDKIEAYKSINRLCDENDIELIVVFPPLYKSHSIFFENRVRQLSNDDVKYYIYNLQNSIYKDTSFYFDDTHLTKEAAKTFTSELIQFLEKDFLN